MGRKEILEAQTEPPCQRLRKRTPEGSAPTPTGALRTAGAGGMQAQEGEKCQQ